MSAETELERRRQSSTSYSSPTIAEFQPGQISTNPIGGRVVIVDRHALVAQSLAMVLTAADVATYVSTEHSIEAVVRQVQAFDPDLVLIDAGSEDAVELVRTVARLGSRALAISDGTDRIRVAACIEAGAAGAVSTVDPVDRRTEDDAIRRLWFDEVGDRLRVEDAKRDLDAAMKFVAIGLAVRAGALRKAGFQG